jgi:sulfotransferase family protein
MRSPAVMEPVATSSPAPTAAGLLYISSSGHSGSTLLDVLLGNHPSISSLGEVNRLSISPYTRICACGTVVARCTFWNGIAEAVAERIGAPQAVTWDTFLVDVPPAKVLFRLPTRFESELEIGGPPSDALREEFRRVGVELSPSTQTGRSAGARETGWWVRDETGASKYLVRKERDELSVYPQLKNWKNPFRAPSLLELGLVSGSRRLMHAFAHVSADVRQQMACARNSWVLADAIASRAGTPWIVDSTKRAARLKLLYLARPESFRVAYLIRDGRAVVASAVRRTGVTVGEAARRWMTENERIRLVTRSIPARQQYRLSYEGLCADPAGTLRGLCGFLGLPFDPAMLSLWSRTVHSIPGNPMLFNRERRAIARDDRWRRELSAADLATFERIAGRFNRGLGYDG